jgi:hypothetical protein
VSAASRARGRTRRGIQAAPTWQPMTRAAWVDAPSMAGFGIDPAMLAQMHEVWVNDRYTVIVERFADGSVFHLSIRRSDRGPARDWRDFMQIKDDIAGPEAEAVELYPGRSRVVDSANQFHLWFLPGGKPFPVGYPKGVTASNVGRWERARQRPLSEPAGRRGTLRQAG